MNDILDQAKLEAGKIVIESLSFAPRTVVGQVVGTMKTRAEEKRLNLELDFDDAVLTDIVMPNMDGERLLKANRDMQAPWDSIPVIAVTADAADGRNDELLMFGFDAVISKPIDPTAFAPTLDAIRNKL